MDAQTYWEKIGFKKDFEDPLYLEKLEPHMQPHSKIVEYGCGYGRMLHFLKEKGYANSIGFDFSSNIIERGKKAHPDLELVHIKESGKIPLEDKCADVVVMSTILCCMINKEDQLSLMEEVRRILKKGGALYLTDFMICNDERYIDKYQEGLEKHGEFGIYTTSEDLTVRHHTSAWIMELLASFDVLWFEQSDFKTMNNNAARTFHCVAKA